MNERSLMNPVLPAVLIVDQLLKGLALVLLAPGERVALLPGVEYLLVESALGVAAPERLRLIVIVLVAALVLLRVQQRGGYGPSEGLALPLLGGGLASNLMDIVLLRQRLGLFELSLPHAQFLWSVADVAVAAGALLVVVDLSRRTRLPSAVALDLQTPPAVEVDLGDLSRGIDNVRVDVQLSARLVAQIRELVGAVLAPQIWWEPWRSAEPNLNPRSLEALRSGYREVAEAALQRAQRERKAALVALVQLATIQAIREEVAATFERLLHEFRRDLEQDRRRGSRTLVRLQQHLHAVRRRKSEIIEQANALLLEQVQRVETKALQDARRALLGTSAGLPAAWFDNPMLCAENPGGDTFLVRHYLLLGHRADDATSAGRIESLLRGWFDCRTSEGIGETGTVPAEAGDAASARREPCPWLDEPDNALRLLDTDVTAEALARARRRYRKDAGALRQRLAYQRLLLRRIETGLRAEGLLNTVLAAYQLAALWPGLPLAANPRLALRYLSDSRQRRELGPRLHKLDRGEGNESAKRQLDAAVRRIERMGARERQRYVLRFVRDFLRYRRDRTRLRLIRGWCEQIKLLRGNEELRLARANRTVYELFSARDRTSVPQVAITGHVIVKADLRGSTTMTSQLAQRGLNPATHFSINFFEPVRSLIELYGAQKVFVEGDAVILALLEREDESAGHLCVARACGLARSIVEVVAAHNSAGSKFGLPILELGIGIAYEPGAPTWLFDDEQPIMISAAIGRADRLSSCAAFLRKESTIMAEHPLQVFQAVGRTPVYEKEGVATFRYNVNGIELEAGAFRKLERELQLNLLDLPSRSPQRGSERFYRARYPDARGVMRNLVLREGRIRRYDRRQGPLGETAQAFYEVVADAERLDRVLDSGAASRSGDDCQPDR